MTPKFPLFDSGDPELSREVSELFGEGIPWASQEEALEEFRSRTFPGLSPIPAWDGEVDTEFPLC